MLPKETEVVWNFLKDQQGLSGFVLVGGSALALLLKHRLSEDLDIAYLDETLPRTRLELLTTNAAQAGLRFEAHDDPAALDEFILGGADLHDYQQDYLVNSKVKVSFFIPGNGLENVLRSSHSDRIRIASLEELFKSKCLVSARRSKTRDWLDLYILFREGGFDMSDYHRAFVEAKVPSQFDLGLSRLCSGVPQKNDEGYLNLHRNPPSVSEMKNYFIEKRNEFEVCRAKEAKGKHGTP